jgi:hypothetical protein
MSIGFHPHANRELAEAGEFYETHARGLGARFLDAVEGVLGILKSYPDLGQPLSATLRSFPVRRFPYSVVYRHLGGRLQVVAIAHHRRRPKYWANRVR